MTKLESQKQTKKILKINALVAKRLGKMYPKKKD